MTASFIIKVNGEQKRRLTFSQLDLDNCVVSAKISPSGYASYYTFKTGDFEFSWEQEKSGGTIEVIEENGSLFEKLGKSWQIVKTIDLPTENTKKE